MNILIIGSGGREHAIGWKIKQDHPEVNLYFAPGNGGTSLIGTNIDTKSIDELILFAQNQPIDLTIVGPEKELVEGIVNDFQVKGLRIFGATKQAALLEGSKVFAKEFMQKYDVKTAAYKTFKEQPMMAKEYLKTQKFPLVIKASGLAAGKGVVICDTIEQAHQTIEDIMENKTFGDAGNEIVIEEYLQGFEASILSIFNGKEITPFISAKDHKKIGENETGLNTGGMGAIAPNPLFTEQNFQDFQNDILEPTLRGLLAENLIFSGVIFFGLMINESGVYLLEYNMRLGDPETQTVLPLMKSDFLSIIENAINQDPVIIEWEDKYACCVVMVSGGYPLNFETGYEIKGWQKTDCPTFIAGAKMEDEELRTNGGRVINVVGIGTDIEQARNESYKNIRHIHFDYEYYRTDIGKL